MQRIGYRPQHTTAETLDDVFRLIKEGQFETAFDYVLHINYLLISDPEQLERYHLAKARCFYGMDQYQDAMRSYMSIERWYLKPKVLNGLGYCYRHLGPLAMAERLFQREEDLLLCARGNDYLAAGSYGKALRTFRSMHDAASNSEAMLGMAQAQEGLGAYARAGRTYQTVMAHWPDIAEQYFQQREAQDFAWKLRQPALYPRLFDLRLEERENESVTQRALDLAQPSKAKRSNF